MHFLDTLFSTITALVTSLNHLRSHFIESGQMTQYNNCNQMRIDFNRLKQDTLEKISDFLEGDRINLPAINQKIEEFRLEIKLLKDQSNSHLFDSAYLLSERLFPLIESFIEEAEHLTAEQKLNLHYKILNFKYAVIE